MKRVADYIGDYVAMPEQKRIVMSAWIVASPFVPLWDRFPILAAYSAEMRSGKTLLLRVLQPIVQRPRVTSSISTAAIFRLIAAEQPTLLNDEAQSVTDGSERSQSMVELLCASIDRGATVARCVGRDHEVAFMPAHTPIILAAIGKPTGVLYDRCVGIELKRKTDADVVTRFSSRAVEPLAADLKVAIEGWVETNRDRVSAAYDATEPLDIENDRMAELLMPLQAVCTVDGLGLDAIRAFADDAEREARDAEAATPGVRLLAAIRELFGQRQGEPGRRFIETLTLITNLCGRVEEPWGTYTRGKPITPEALAALLRPHGIRSGKSPSGKSRGFYERDFVEAWLRYLPAVESAP